MTTLTATRNKPADGEAKPAPGFNGGVFPDIVAARLKQATVEEPDLDTQNETAITPPIEPLAVDASNFDRVLIALDPDSPQSEILIRRVLRTFDTDLVTLKFLGIGRKPSLVVPVIQSTLGTASAREFMPALSSFPSTADQKQKRLDSLIASVRALATCETTVALGDPAEAVAREANDWHPDLVIMTAENRRWFSLFAPRTEETVAKEIDCPFLLVTSGSENESDEAA
ncbi:MAG: universal stress protein [Pseudomonadota bacterium]